MPLPLIANTTLPLRLCRYAFALKPLPLGLCLTNIDARYFRQQYLEHKLVALAEDYSDVIIDDFLLPSGCSCHFTRDSWEM